MHPLRDFLRKRCSENMQQSYRKTLMLKSHFNKVVLLCEFHEIFHNRFFAKHPQANASASMNS